MSDDNEIRHGRHCIFKMHVHLVFMAKYRRKVVDGDAIDRLGRMFARVYTDVEASLVEMDGESDHVHFRRLRLKVATQPNHLDEVCRAFRSIE